MGSLGAMAKDQIQISILTYTKSIDEDLSKWYVGITDNPTRRLGEHQKDPRQDLAEWKQENGAQWWETRSELTAREIEDFCLQHEMKGGSGGGKTESNVVYVYRTGKNTKE